MSKTLSDKRQQKRQFEGHETGKSWCTTGIEFSVQGSGGEGGCKVNKARPHRAHSGEARGVKWKYLAPMLGFTFLKDYFCVVSWESSLKE